MQYCSIVISPLLIQILLTKAVVVELLVTIRLQCYLPALLTNLLYRRTNNQVLRVDDRLKVKTQAEYHEINFASSHVVNFSRPALAFSYLAVS